MYHKWQSNDYGSWDIEPDRQIFLLFRTSLTTQNIKILKKFKKHLEISSFYTNASKIMIICHTATEIWCVTHVIIFHFGPLFTLLPPNCPKNEDFQKMKKTPGDAIILHKWTKNHDHMLYCFWDMVHDRYNLYFFILDYFLAFYPHNSLKN